MFARTTAAVAALAILLTAIPAGRAAAAPVSSTDLDEIELSYTLLTSEFYKRVDSQTVLNGARNAVVAALKKGGVASPAVPAIRLGDDRNDDVRQVQRLVSQASEKYGNKVSSHDLTYEAISGMLASVNDRYTTFLTPKQFAELNGTLDPSFSGVGIVMHIDDQSKLLTVGDIIEAGPADRAGLKVGDTILTIDGKSTKGLSADDDAKMLRGRSGTVVRLSIERKGEPVPEIAVTRAVIHAPSVSARMLDNKIGYARLSVFGASTSRELATALDKFQAEGAKAYILDLRYNGGGYLDAAVNVSSKFIASGPIVSVEARGGSETEMDADNTAVPPKPLVVLVNRYSASASEITSGAIQDSGVGELVGERTFGKGVVQTMHPLPDGSAVKITTARYLTPKGRDINSVGIQPDIYAPAPKSGKLGDPQSDTQLQAAIDYLTKEIATRTAAARAVTSNNVSN